MKNTTRTSVGDRPSGAADGALDATTHAIDGGRQFATDVANRMGETASELRHGAADLARASAAAIGDATAAAQRKLGQYIGATRRYLAEQPVKAALIAAAVGAAAAALMLVVLRSRRNDRVRH